MVRIDIRSDLRFRFELNRLLGFVLRLRVAGDALACIMEAVVSINKCQTQHQRERDEYMRTAGHLSSGVVGLYRS